MTPKKTWLGKALSWVAGFVLGFGEFMSAQWKQFTPMGQALFAVAVVMVLVDAAISFKFGMSQTWVHGVGFAGLAFAFFLLPDAAVSELRKKNWAGGLGLGVACVPLFGVCLWTHVGYSSGVRLGDIEQSGFSHAAYASADKTLTEKRGTLKMLQDQHITLSQQTADALNRNKGWSVSTDPQAMKSSLETIEKMIADEKAGKRGRKAGCLGECEKLMKQRADLVAAISLATKENDLAERIASLEKEIEAKAKEVASLAPSTSTVVSQTKMAAKLVNIVAYFRGTADEAAVMQPSAFLMDIANTAAAGISAFAMLIVGATLMLAAGCNRKIGALLGHETSVGSPGNRTAASPSAGQDSASSYSIEVRTVGDLQRRLRGLQTAS